MSEDYLSYKQNKLNAKNEKKGSKRKVAALFLITFGICFFFVLNVITKYGARIDIEYGRAIQPDNGLPDMDGPFVRGSNPISDMIDDKKTQIDSRLRVLYLEETAPSEARIIGSSKEKVLDIAHYNKLIDEKKQKEEDRLAKLAAPKPAAAPPPPPKVVISKVLIGHFRSFEDAKYAQNQLRETNDSITFIRKMGEIYSLQVGSYTDENVAQTTANKYNEAGYPVWILQD